jgi:hypothetical protein
MSDNQPRWNSFVASIPSEAQYVLLLEAIHTDRDELSNALRTSGRTVTAYGRVSELESDSTPSAVDFVIYAIGFGQDERPHEAWSVIELLDAAHISVSPDRIRIIYHEDDFVGQKEPNAIVRDVLRVDSFERDPWSELRSTPVVRERLRFAYQMKIFELGVALTIVFLALWGVFAPSLTCLIAVAICSPFVTAFSVNEVVRLVHSHVSNKPSQPEPEMEYVRRKELEGVPHASSPLA